MKLTNPGPHLDHMIRQTRVYHVQLVSMADLKANILLTISSVVVTLCFRYIQDPNLQTPAFVLITFCLITIFLAVYTVMPKIPASIKLEKDVDVHNPAFNLLFFTDFLKLDYQEYEKAMEEAMNDPSRSYELMLREIYILGQFLATKKYRFVRLAYMTFILGFIMSGLALILF